MDPLRDEYGLQVLSLSHRCADIAFELAQAKAEIAEKNALIAELTKPNETDRVVRINTELK